MRSVVLSSRLAEPPTIHGATGERWYLATEGWPAVVYEYSATYGVVGMFVDYRRDLASLAKAGKIEAMSDVYDPLYTLDPFAACSSK